MKLNLGSKHHKLEGFIDIDISRKHSPDRIMDVRSLDYETESVDVIYAGHLIEHFDSVETPMILSEWKRVLKKGGVLIMSFPDFEKVMILWTNGIISIRHINKYIFANEVGGQQSHKQVMSVSIAERLLGSVEEITGCPYVAGGDMNWQSVVKYTKI